MDKLKEALNGLMTIRTSGNDTITMAQCMLVIDNYIKEQERTCGKANENE